MTPDTLQDQLTKYLTDVHSIEQQALAQMRTAPKLVADDPSLVEAFSAHLPETEEHERLVRQRLEARNASPATIKDLLGTLTGKGFGAFAASQPDTPGKLVAHAFSYEHMEESAYELLRLLAERVGDEQTVAASNSIQQQEHAMGERLSHLFDDAVTGALREVSPDDLGEQLNKYLADAHAIEEQAVQLLSKGPGLAGDPELAAAYTDHLAEAEEHARLVERRLEERGSNPSKLKDAALRVGALNWGAFFAAQPDTPAKLAAFAYAFEHLEIAGYELLRRVAERAGDPETVELAERILAEERAAAERVWGLLARALDASLHEQSLPAR
jgi:ferritin-like metal-binding protein YciE